MLCYIRVHFSIYRYPRYATLTMTQTCSFPVQSSSLCMPRPGSTRTDVLEPIRSAILLLQPTLTCIHLTRLTPPTLRRVRTVVEWNVIVSDIPKPASHRVSIILPPQHLTFVSKHSPMNLTGILKQPQRNTMHRRITPPLVKEPTRTIQMCKILLIRLTPPKAHISDFKITPEMTRRVAMRF